MSRWKLYPESNVKIIFYIWRNVFYKKDKEIITDLYIIIYVSLLRLIYLHW